MNLIDTLKLWDTNLFLLLNGLHAPYFDGFMFAVSEKLTWIPLYLSIILVTIKYRRSDALWIILAFVLCIVIADQISSGLIKNTVQRLRPSRVPELADAIHLVRGYTGGRYGFVSSHAANAVAFAVLSSLVYRNRFYVAGISFWAFITAYSRIYLGVHYPLDIVGGGMVGVLAALICYYALKRFRPMALRHETADNKQTQIPLAVLSLSFLAIAVYSFFF